MFARAFPRAPRLRRIPRRDTTSAPSPPPASPAPVAAGLVGLAAGTLGSCAGVGGAVFVIPGLMRFCRVPQRVAAGSSLVAVTVIAGTSALSFASADAVDWPTAAVLSGGAATCSPLGALFSRRLNGAVLRRMLGVLVIAVAPLMPVRSHLLSRRRYLDAQHGAGETAPSAAAAAAEEGGAAMRKGAGLAVAGAGIGFSSGMLGVGGGNFFTAVVAVASDGSLRTVLGTALASMVVPSGAAAVAYVRMGQVCARIVPPLVVGSVVGAATGSRIALAAPESVLQWGFAVVFTLLGLRMCRAPLKGVVGKGGMTRAPPRGGM